MTGERQIATSLSGIQLDHQNRYKWALKEIGAGKFIIDAACGVGYGTAILSKGNKVIGIDCDADALLYAYHHWHTPGNEFFKGDVITFLYPQADVIISFETIEHVKDAESMLKRFRHNAPMLIGSVPNEEVVPFSKKTHPFHYRHYTKDQIKSLLRQTGWEVTQWMGQENKRPGHVIPWNENVRTHIFVAR